jgi:tight adherence protein C
MIMLPQAISSGLSMLPLVAAMMLLAGGIALIASGSRTRDEALVRRVAMVEPYVRRTAPHGAALEDYLIRLPLTGLSEAAQREVIRRMVGFGVRQNRALLTFTLARAGFAALIGLILSLWTYRFAAIQALPLISIAIFAMGAITGWFVPLIFIDYGVRRRTREVKAGMPDALELLVVCVEAGLSLEDGLDRVVTELGRSQPALADELGITLADLKILPSRDRALANFAARIDIPSVRAVITTLAQTLRYGTPLAQSLRVVASEMRNDALIDLEERANRLPAYLTIPVMLFLMPTIFLIVGGPAALRLFDAFHR